MKDRFIIYTRIITSARFLKLPRTSKLLYFYLNADADDDGIVDAYSVMYKIHADEGELGPLVDNNFIKILDPRECLTFITDWSLHNTNMDMRYHRHSQHISLLAQIVPDALVTVAIKENGKYTKNVVPAKEALKIIDANKNKMLTHGNHMGSHGIPTAKTKQDNTSKDNNSLELLSLLEEKNQILEYICPVCNGLKILEDKSICYQCNGSGYITYLKGR